MDDEDDVFSDTISVNSYSSAVSRRTGNYIGLSRSTVYHSAEDLELVERGHESATDDMDSPEQQNQVPERSGAVTYSQWRTRTWSRFHDGKHNVDFVLAYTSKDEQHGKIREIFENHLIEEGLMLEREEIQKLHFVKIHAPKEVLCRYSEIMKIRMPIKDMPGLHNKMNRKLNVVRGFKAIVSKVINLLQIRLDENKFPNHRYRMTAEFARDKDYLFDIDSENFFPTAVKLIVVHFILERQKFTDRPDNVEDVGIHKLLADGVYKAAYPLHDGNQNQPNCKRSLLVTEWASVSKALKYQPIDEIKNYLGVQVALYFAWLGFYTYMLIPAAFIGLICIIYGAATFYSNSLAQDTCDSDIIMCPRCDEFCDYWDLSDACTYTRLTHLFDNPVVIFFAVFMSLWAALYLELWKRFSAEIAHRWGLTGFTVQAEHPRPEYLARLANAKKKKLNVITLMYEPAVPFWKVKFPSLLVSFSVVFFWMLIAVGAVFGIVVYRMSLLTSGYIYGDQDNSYYKSFIPPVTAGIINLICIFILNKIYDYLAEALTEMELQRTQTEYEDSLTLKIYLFQAINFYSSIFYIAFLKGKFVGYPAKYNRIFGFRQEECGVEGCLMELCIQLAIIMIGKQALNATLEYVLPILTKIFYKLTNKILEEEKLISCNQWTEDYKLLNFGGRGLFAEYLEMVLQYGFVTIFVTAFPLAPLFALINNIFEMRLDAKKFLLYYRRPVPRRVKDIGVWYHIMHVVGRISVISNAFIIAFSSNFIPNLVYKLTVNPKHNDEGYLNSTLSYFDIEDFQDRAAPLRTVFDNITLCRYPDYRNPPWDENRYKRPALYWHILAARLAFIVVYQNVVSLIVMAIQWAIPDVPRKLRDQIKREALRTSEIIIKQEKLRARTRTSVSDDVKELHHEPGKNGVQRRIHIAEAEDDQI